MKLVCLKCGWFTGLKSEHTNCNYHPTRIGLSLTLEEVMALDSFCDLNNASEIVSLDLLNKLKTYKDGND